MIYGFKRLYQTLMCLITFSPCSRNWRIVWSFLCSILLFFRMTQKMVLRTHYETLLSFRLYLRWEGITWTTPQQSKALHIADPGLSKQTILFLRTFFYKLYVKKKKQALYIQIHYSFQGDTIRSLLLLSVFCDVSYFFVKSDFFLSSSSSSFVFWNKGGECAGNRKKECWLFAYHFGAFIEFHSVSSFSFGIKAQCFSHEDTISK